jgi:hypothetical protein
MRPDSITLALFEKYTPEEMAATAQKMAQAQADYESVEVEKKVSDAAFNERLKKLAADVSEHAKKYNKGGETAQIGCDISYDHPEPGKKSYFRMDRNELVETHDMSWEEKQETIQFPLAEAAAPTPTADQVAQALASIPAGEEVTRLCHFPGCTLFADHDGEHEFRQETSSSEAGTPQSETTNGEDMPHQPSALPDPSLESSVEERARTRKRKKLPPVPPPDAQPGTEPGAQP